MLQSNHFLIDECLSPLLAQNLRSLGYSATTIREIAGFLGASDEAIIEWAKENKAIIVTCDLDFGELWYWYFAGHIGIIVLRLPSQDVKSQISCIEYLHRESILKRPELSKSLVISREHRYRIRQK